MNRDQIASALSQVDTLAGIADYLGITTEALYRLQRRYESFPEPVAELVNTRIYVVQEVLSWHRDVGRIYARR